MRISRVALWLLTVSLIYTVPHVASGAFIFNVTQVGPNISIVGSGAINTASLSLHSTALSSPELYPRLATLVAGPTTLTSSAVYYGASGPDNFGIGSVAFSPIGTGDVIGTTLGSTIELPANYVSNSPLADSDIINNQTLLSLGLTAGTYLYTWGSGPTADSLTINIGVVPEPASAALIAAPIAIAALRRRRRHLV